VEEEGEHRTLEVEEEFFPEGDATTIP